MEPSAATPPVSRSAGIPAGELLVSTGRKTRRFPLKVPLTFVGKDEGCDLRLNQEGIDPIHCVCVQGPGGVLVRDLNSSGGTFVNGNRIANVVLKDGDKLTVGPVKIQVHLEAAARASEPSPGELDALRVQAAAVAAQQSALGEEEAKLSQRKGALEQQEEQLASHLEEKRRKLVALHQKTHTERTALQKDRAAYEQYLDKVTGDLSQAQLDLVEKQQHLQSERKRLTRLVKRLKQRFQEQWKQEKERVALREEEVANESANTAHERASLERREAALAEDRLNFNADYELGRRQLSEAWVRLRHAQHGWRKRRGAERAALELREQELASAEVALGEQQRDAERYRAQWQTRHDAAENELEGLDRRAANQRTKIAAQQAELDRLEALLRERRAQLDNERGEPAAEAPSAGLEDSPARLADSPDLPPHLHNQVNELDRLAALLAGQRLQLTEQWDRLARTQERWRQEQARTAAELEGLIQHTLSKEDAVKGREQQQTQTEAALKQRHQELIQLHQQLVAWRARLRAREQTWEGERNRFMADLRHREELADNNLTGLVEIRQRWSKRRRQELAQMRDRRAVCERLRSEFALLRDECVKQRAALEDEKKNIAERGLALEQFRNELFARSGDTANAERRVERLRRRLENHYAAAARTLIQDREALQAELAAIDTRYQDLEKQATEIVTAETALAEKLTAFEHKQTMSSARNARMQTDLQNAQAQRACAEQELAKAREEVERIARSLLSEHEAPAQTVDKAA